MSPDVSGGYFALLARIHAYLLPRTYIEIGVFKGHSFNLVPPRTVSIGIDPNPLPFPLRRSSKLFKSTSDDFFDQNDLGQLMGARAVDIAFVDGMHLFEYALRDFMHLEAFCHPNSLILVHDCYPVDETTAARVRTTTDMWSGDVWKLIVCLKEYRPDLRIATVDVPPTGLGIITGLDPSSTVLKDRFAEIVGRVGDIDYSMLADDKAGVLNRVPDDWNAILQLLPAPFRTGSAALLMQTRAAVRKRLRRLRWQLGTSVIGRVFRAAKGAVVG